MRPTFPLSFALCCLLLLPPGVARAAEGVLQLNQACAAEGCFPGDDPGWPVTIASPGSYRLTSALDLTGIAVEEYGSAVHVTADGPVALDLNGFAVRGPVECTLGFTLGCNTAQASSTQAGILASGSAALTLGNGRISGFSYGVYCFGRCEISGVQASSHSGDGIRASGAGSVVRESAATLNSGAGINASGLVERSVVDANTIGMFVGEGSQARGNLVRGNLQIGLGCMGCQLVDNVVHDNQATGVSFSGDAAWRGNSVHGNAPDVSGSAIQLGPNQCGAALCP